MLFSNGYKSLSRVYFCKQVVSFASKSSLASNSFFLSRVLLFFCEQFVSAASSLFLLPIIFLLRGIRFFCEQFVSFASSSFLLRAVRFFCEQFVSFANSSFLLRGVFSFWFLVSYDVFSSLMIFYPTLSKENYHVFYEPLATLC